MLRVGRDFGPESVGGVTRLRGSAGMR